MTCGGSKATGLLTDALAQGTDVPGRVLIRVVRASAGHAAKPCVLWAAGFAGTAALRTGPAGVAVTDDGQHDPLASRLVFDKGAQLVVKGPAPIRARRALRNRI